MAPRTRPLKTCAEPGCPELTQGTLCQRHEAQRLAGVNARRPARHRTYDARWDRARRAQLARHPSCQCDDPACRCGGECHRTPTPATVVDHVVPRRHFDTAAAMHDPQNLRSLCAPCHNSKTARRDGGFGRTADT